jgi:putative ABC transport system substrate-binding protein
MRRRDFIAGLGTTTAWPLVARAQQAPVPVIGFLNSGPRGLFTERVDAFRRGLSETGYEEGRNLAIEYRWAEGQYDRLPALAADLVNRRVAAIAANLTAAVAAKAATSTISIVFAVASDPIEIGLVTSLNRPGGNLTGVTSLGAGLGPKQLEILRVLLPNARTMALLVNPVSPNSPGFIRDAEAAARTLQLELRVMHASTDDDFDKVFNAIVQLGVEGLLLGPDTFLSSRYPLLAAMSLRHAVPAISQYRDFAAAGGLMSYGGSINENFHLVGAYTGRILKGEKAGDLPVQQVTKIEMVLNLRTAKAFRLRVPEALLARADSVIE